MTTASSSPTLKLISSPEQFETVFLLGSIAPGWFVRHSLRLRLEHDENGSCLASDDQLAIYGEGADRQAAIQDYGRSIIEYYELIEEEARDHPPTQELFKRICWFVAKMSR